MSAQDTQPTAVDGLPRKLNVSVAVHKDTNESSVVLRDLADGKLASMFAHLMVPTEARRIAGWLLHAADVAEASNALRDRLSGVGYTHEVVQRAITQRTTALLGQGHEETAP